MTGRGWTARGRISIHALHEESDPPRPADSRSNRDFNPRSP